MPRSYDRCYIDFPATGQVSEPGRARHGRFEREPGLGTRSRYNILDIFHSAERNESLERRVPAHLVAVPRHHLACSAHLALSSTLRYNAT